MAKRVNDSPARKAAEVAEDFEYFLSKLSPKARAAVDKHLELSAADAALGNAKHWKRLAGLLSRLAPHVVEMTGSALKFHIADGKYRQQVFALEDTRQGVVRIFIGDVVEQARKRGLLGPGDGPQIPVKATKGLHLTVETINAESKEVPDFCRPMLGWGRKAVHTGLPATADEAHVRIIEQLCELAAEAWTVKEKAAATATAKK